MLTSALEGGVCTQRGAWLLLNQGQKAEPLALATQKSPAPALMSEKATACDAEQQRACGKCKGVRL